MGVWGKIIGGVIGFSVGGPVGAAVGITLGHAVDKDDNNNDEKEKQISQEERFSLSCIILSAKLAKCDGAVNRKEIDSFKQIFPVTDDIKQEVGQLFDMARQHSDNYESFARLLGQTFKNDPDPLEELLENLFIIARSDLNTGESLTPEEEAFLRHVHTLFGLNRGIWESLKNNKARTRTTITVSDAYAILGVSHSLSDEELRKHWKSLVRQYHPDVMTARNASEKDIKEASTKMASINAAWDIIKSDRGL